MTGNGDAARGRGVAAGQALVRWECRCQQTPVLLATYDEEGCIHIKARDRYWHVHGRVETICPRCGSAHALDLRSREEVGKSESR
jgi:hypothetical protein